MRNTVALANAINSTPSVSYPQVDGFMEAMLDDIGAGFHPDTPCEEYVTGHDERIYSVEEYTALNMAMDKCLAQKPDYTYDIAFELMWKKFQAARTK